MIFDFDPWTGDDIKRQRFMVSFSGSKKKSVAPAYNSRLKRILSADRGVETPKHEIGSL